MYYIGICDDDSVFIEYIKRLFSRFCTEIEFYEYLSGEELVQDMQKQEKYDLLVLDVAMPGMDGNETAKKFREQFPDTLLVFCSGVCMPTVQSFETVYRRKNVSGSRGRTGEVKEKQGTALYYGKKRQSACKAVTGTGFLYFNCETRNGNISWKFKRNLYLA